MSEATDGELRALPATPATDRAAHLHATPAADRAARPDLLTESEGEA